MMTTLLPLVLGSGSRQDRGWGHSPHMGCHCCLPASASHTWAHCGYTQTLVIWAI